MGSDFVFLFLLVLKKLFFFFLVPFSLDMIASQYCVGFCHTTMYTFISTTSIDLSPPSKTFAPPLQVVTEHQAELRPDSSLALATYVTYSRVYMSMRRPKFGLPSSPAVSKVCSLHPCL